MSHSLRIAGLGLVLALGACALPKAGEQAAAPAAQGGTCDAAAKQGLVGTSAGALNPADLPKGTRVLFPGMAATGEPNANRLTVTIDKSDKVARVYCG